MTDDVTIRFTADVSGLQEGLQQAKSAMQSTAGALRSGVEQINASFASLSQTSAGQAARKVAAVRASAETELAIARQQEQARFNIALNGVREQSSLVKQLAVTGQISRQEELSGLLALEAKRESIEHQHLQFLQSKYQQGTVAFAAAQRRLDELASQSALRRREIEQNVTQQIHADYRRGFEQIGSSISSSLTGMITGQMKFRDAARNIVTQLLQMFIQAKVRMVANWLAGMAAQTASTQAGEAAKTAAVAAGTAARAGLEQSAATASGASVISKILKSIFASAGETFAGVFGFLSPIMGPAAAGPAAASQATVLAVGTGLASFAKGSWELPSDMIVQVHKGEMIVPSGPAAALRSALTVNPGSTGTVHVNHAVNFNVSAMDSRSVKQFFHDHGRLIMRTVNESVRTGAHIGLSKLGTVS